MKVFFAGNTGTPGRERAVQELGAAVGSVRRLVSFYWRGPMALVIQISKEARNEGQESRKLR